MRVRRAFTLVELLVVIGIIALLIAILLPSLSAARRSAQSSACLSNEKQIYLGLFSYSNDHKGWIPPVIGEQWFGYPTWSQYLSDMGDMSSPSFPGTTFRARPYINDRKAFVCPSQNWRDASNPQTWRGSYGMNGRMAGDDPTQAGAFTNSFMTHYSPRPGGGAPALINYYNIHRTRLPIEMYLVSDNPQDSAGSQQYSLLYNTGQTPDFRHGNLQRGGAVSMLYHDGHAVTLTRPEVKVERYRFLPWWNRLGF